MQRAEEADETLFYPALSYPEVKLLSNPKVFSDPFAFKNNKDNEDEIGSAADLFLMSAVVSFGFRPLINEIRPFFCIRV